MSEYEVEYSYSVPEYAAIVVDLGDELTHLEKEDLARYLIRQEFPGIDDIAIENIKEFEVVNGAN